ncbi:DUF4349 domain-containing protein [Paenibacillus eucommiae]|uniref:Outer membrane murein-binding lipoprotein Lpp n=1 Tax=Paenibacillus eucommiae TaxID=1355755 RepID=A0ABS4IZ29_9BACL|nr:DUF4349 domain-containing protein [Paenibacillus eucommiae]MBP1992805.1 outer membrane murein-binding lipoprotein Lpp [Paenibacillus eucommiae]
MTANEKQRMQSMQKMQKSLFTNQQQAGKESKPRVTASWRKAILIVGAAILMMAALAGCSSSKDEASNTLSMANTNSEPASSALEGQSSVDQSGLEQTSPKAEEDLSAAEKQINTNTDGEVYAVTPAIGKDGAEGFNRKLIYQANLVMRVKDYTTAQTELRDLVALSGAYILQFSENTNNGERGGHFTIKVGANGFTSLLDGLEKISPSLQRSVNGQDVSEEYVDLESRLKAKQAVEARLLAFMEKATKTDDLLAFSNQLAKEQEEIEKIKGRMRYIDQNVAFSTIELRMYQQTGSGSHLNSGQLALGDRLQNALNTSLNVLAAVLQGILVFLAAALPVLLVAAIILVPVLYFRRGRKQRLAETCTQIKQQNAAVATPVKASEEQNEESST